MKRWLYPLAIERQYLRTILRLVVAPLERATLENLEPLLPLLAESRLDGDGQRADAVDLRDVPPSTGWLETLRTALVTTLTQAGLGDEAVAEIVAAVFDATAGFNRKQFDAVLRSVYRVDVITPRPELRAALALFEQENIALIKSIPQQALGRLHGRMLEGVRTGRSLQDLRKMIQEDFGVTRRRAELIARDQVGKLNGQLTELRQAEIGVEEYTWRGVMDQRERPEHVAREGKVFKWSEPPEDGHPGQPIRCRCGAEPVLPSWEELEKRITGVAPPPGTYD